MVEKVFDNRELSARLMALEERVGRLETGGSEELCGAGGEGQEC